MSSHRTAPYLIFADLAFFLFAVLVMGYQFVRFADDPEVKDAIQKFAVDLPQLPFTPPAVPTDPSEGRVVALSLPRDGTWRMEAHPVPHAQLPVMLQEANASRCVAEVDRLAPAEGVVALLGAANTRPDMRLEVRYLTHE